MTEPADKSSHCPLNYDIGGMHCAACSSRIERVLSKMPGVEKASVNLASARALVWPAPDASPDIKREIMDKVASIGFSAQPADGISEEEAYEKSRKKASEERAKRLRRLRPMIIFSVPLLIVSMGHMLGMPLPAWLEPRESPRAYILAQILLTLPVIWLGRHFYYDGFAALLRRAPNMDSLVAVGTGAAFLFSIANAFLGLLGDEPVSRSMNLYFESCAVLLAMIESGQFLEFTARGKAADAMGALLSVAPDSALLLLESGETAEIPLSAVKTGDKLVVRPGSRIPADGVVIDGHSAIDLSLLTGESIPEAAGPGDKLVGGSLNGEGSLVMEVQATGQNTKLSRIIRLVREAQGSKAPIARLADKASYYFVPAVMLFAVLSAAAWALFSREPYTVALTVFVAILVMACPCAMGLATPMSIMVGAGRGASLGVLIKNGAALERAGQINALCVDKTGTLTAGKPALTSVISLKTPGGTISRKQLLSIAASLEGRSEHPLGLAIIEAAKNENCEYGAASNISIRPGLGIAGDIAFDNALYYAGIGNEAFAREHGLEINPDTGDKLASLADEGQTPLLMFARQPGGELGLTAIFALADQLRPETPDVIARLKKMGVRPVMLTGDNDRTARAIAKAAGIEEFYARLLPERKAGFIKKLREEGKIVGMVGDGLNDAPALATADVGFAVGDGVDVSAEAGDIVLMRGGMRAILTALELSRATMRNIKENLGWAFGYNILGLPVAAGLLYAFGGPMLSPMIAGLAMALSSFSVVMNASRLRGFGKKADGTR